MNTTAIKSALDHEISQIIARLSHDDAILAVCLALGKNPGDYAHLDNGRRKMTAGNLARGAAKKDASFIEKLRAQTAGMEDAPKYKRPSRSKAAKAARGLEAEKPLTWEEQAEEPAEPVIEWPSNKRFQFARVLDGAWTFSYTRKTADDIARA